MSQLHSVFKKSKSTWQFECLSELECSGKVLVEYIVGLYWWSILLEYTDSLWYPEIYRQLYPHPGDQATAKNLYADAVKV